MTTKIKTYALPALAALMLWREGRKGRALVSYYRTNGTIQLGDGTAIRPNLRTTRCIFDWHVMTGSTVPLVVSEGSYVVIDEAQLEREARSAPG